MPTSYPLRHSLQGLLLILGGLLALALILDGVYNADRSAEEEACRQITVMGQETVMRLECFTNDTLAAGQRWKMALLNCDPRLLESSIYDPSNLQLAHFCADHAESKIPARPNMAALAMLNAARLTGSAQIQLSHDGNFLSAAFPFRLAPGKTGTGGVALLKLDLRPAKDLQLVRNFRRAAMICCVALALVALSWSYLNRTFTRRIATLMAATRGIAEGDLTRRVSLSGRDEFAELGKAFNQMAAQMQTRTQALSESEERYRRIVETAYEGIFALDATHQLSFVNRRLAEMLGYSIDTMTGHPLKDFLFDEDWAGHLDRMARRQFSEACRYEQRLRRQDGAEVWAIMSTAILQDASGQFIGAISMVTDITERRELEAKLRQTQKMEAISHLAGGVAHEFNNILTVILGYAQILGTSPNLDPNEQEMLREISGAGRRANDLTRQLQLFSRKKPIQCRPFNLNQILDEMLGPIRRIVGDQITVQLVCDPAIADVPMDPDMIRQAVENLSDNAHDLMPDGGRLTIAAQQVELTAPDCGRNPEARAGRFVRLSVSDTGRGIEPQALQRVFEPVFTTKSALKQNGFGLAAVYGIVKQHKGWVEVASKLNHGTTFNLYLPADNGSVPARNFSTPNPAQNGAALKTILLVEDDPSLRGMARACLFRVGYRVLEAVDGSAAQEIWSRAGASIDLLFADVMLPGGLSGHELAKLFREQRPDLKVLFSSGYSREHLPAMPGGLAPEHHLTKPFDPERMIQVIQHMLNGGPKAK
jgi:PAS domain S-box-containing protein